MKRLMFTLLVGTSLVGCHRSTDKVDVIDTPKQVVENGHVGDVIDTHYDYVTGLGFTNVINPNGTTYNTHYVLNKDYAAKDEIFNQWRHTWVEPADYVDKNIDVYRYTGTLDGEERVVYVLSNEGHVIGGFHHGVNETIENARILEEGSYVSRLGNDFRTFWDDLFGIKH